MAMTAKAGRREGNEEEEDEEEDNVAGADVASDAESIESVDGGEVLDDGDDEVDSDAEEEEIWKVIKPFINQTPVPN
jgi:hypothetical protein